MKIFGEEGPEDKNSLQLATKRGNRIPNQRKFPRPPVAMAEAIKMVKERHPDADLRSKSSSYNCVGLVIASRRTFVHPRHLEWVLKDDGYQQIDPKSAEIGDVVVYRRIAGSGEPDHVGVICKIDRQFNEPAARIWVLSQWGDDGEYMHRLLDVDTAHGKNFAIFSERII